MRSRKLKTVCHTSESMEVRQVLAAGILASLNGNVLTIEGTDKSDAIYVTQSDGKSRNISVGSTPGGNNYGTFSGSRVARLEITGLGGDDLIDLKGVKGAHAVKVPAKIWGDGTVEQKSDGNDRILGGKGADEIRGGGGKDVIDGQSGSDSLYGGSHDDELSGGDGDDTIFGGTGNDVLTGGNHADRLFGEVGIDWLYGGDGDDYLSGGEDTDHIFGGMGVDTFARSLFLPGSGLFLSGEDEERGNEPAEVTGAFLTEATITDSYADIDQDGSPTCAFLATLSSVARTTGESDDLVRRIQYDAGKNLYGISFCTKPAVEATVLGVTITLAKAEYKTVWVDGDWTEGRDPGGKLWVTLYQKAYLQLQGAVTRDSRGAALLSTAWKAVSGKAWNNVADIYLALTGKAASFVRSADATSQKMFDQLSSSTRGMVASSLDKGTSSGVIENHCYSVLGLFRDEKGNWLVRLRNPWAHDGRDGAMYDRNSEKQQFADDGLITLTWSQFARNFRGYYKV